MLTKKDKEEVTEMIVDGIREVIMPTLENMSDDIRDIKTRLGSVETRLGTVETRLDVVERKLDNVIDNQLEDRVTLRIYQQRLGNIESIPSIAHQLRKK